MAWNSLATGSAHDNVAVMQATEVLHLVHAKVQEGAPAIEALAISSSAGITAPAELTDQLLADLRKTEASHTALRCRDRAPR